MPEVLLTRDDNGKLCGLTEVDDRALGRWRGILDELVQGQLVKFSYRLARSPRFHRKHMKMLAVLFDMQEQFLDRDMFRYWLQVGAGHCEYVPGPMGKPVAVSKSINFEQMDDAEFAEHHEAVKRFLRSPHAAAFLWPHVPPEQREVMVESVLEEFEQ